MYIRVRAHICVYIHTYVHRPATASATASATRRPSLMSHGTHVNETFLFAFGDQVHVYVCDVTMHFYAYLGFFAQGVLL